MREVKDRVAGGAKRQAGARSSALATIQQQATRAIEGQEPPAAPALAKKPAGNGGNRKGKREKDVFGVPRAALAFADCPGEDGNVAVAASMAATRAALAQAWLEAQEADRAAAAAAAAAAAQEQQLLLQQQRAAALQAAVMTASELVFGVQQPQQLPAWQAAAGVGAKVAAAGAGAVAAGGEDDDDDVSDLMALLCA
ncbi:hypothetical protein HXX76_013852 [Chlamydomonas incerta]|uniref:Uncharacterized protein n=1 Tax=Chlamydomonas incerta TaxID=51695 RepID=A0A835SRG9_CHLIN|nr:hypothetical protein HXX76_013852 [Chlamydomonas incerta]|eukprot:KAG2425270.1 hypothetical protein HXX76_013852 [Chlamydomonas incerta]